MIGVIIEAPLDSAAEEFIRRAAQRAIEHEDVSSEADATITLSDDDKLHSLNKTYLDIDAPTDVLSFPAAETDPQTGRLQLGDVIISVPRAVAQAEQAGHPLQAEIELLVVHGVLHLLGYDHANEAEKAAMWAAQKEVLTSLGSKLARYPD